MKTLLLAGALTLALASTVATKPSSLAQPDAPWARIIHTVR